MTELRWARPDERDKVQDYLFEKMGKISHETWRNILDCRWNQLDDQFGIIVEQNGSLVGFLGIVFADRILSDKPHRTGNITSWFLEKHLRRSGLGQEMLAMITQADGVSYTATSANFRSGALLKKIGWELLEDSRLLWYRSNDKTPVRFNLLSGRSAVQGQLNTHSLEILNDHRTLNLTPHLLVGPKGENLFFLTYIKHKGEEGTAYHEILYANDPGLLTEHVSNIANCLLPDNNAVLSSDKRFLLASAKADDVQSLHVHRYFKPFNRLPASQVDFLYGEVVLLDLKIY